MSTEETGTGQTDRSSGTRKESGAIPDSASGNGVGLGAGEANTFEPEEGTDSQGAAGSEAASGGTSVGKAEDTPDVDQTPVDTTEPS
jgi:hypothetical protein